MTRAETRKDESDAWTARLAETEYVKVVDPRFARPARFGTFYRHPGFPERHDANQLLRVRCGVEEVPALLAEVDELYAGSGLPFRRLSGHTPTWPRLAEALEALGWSVHREAMKVHRRPAAGPANPDVAIRALPPDSPDLERLRTHDGRLDPGFVFGRAQYDRVGGEYLVGYLAGRPACCTGWFFAGRIARFRYVYTAPWARGQGCARGARPCSCSPPPRCRRRA